MAFKGVVNNQIQDFIRLLHEVEKQKLVQRMQSEKWDRVDFSSKDAVVLTRIIQSMTTDPPPWLDYTNASAIGLETGERDLRICNHPTEPTGTVK